ncbi:MAG: hypothetical protein QXQ40_01265 [Candidatus Aenigmatarchaeota archaeon]
MKRIYIYLLASTLCILASISIALAFGPRFASKEQRLVIKQAIENNDFEAWKTAIIETLTKENFKRLVERYKLMSERKELQNKIRQAIKDGDYQAYKEAVEELIGSYKVMSEEEFNVMVQRYNETGIDYIGKYSCLRERFNRHDMRW